jgi:hypothetical protein
LTNCFGLSIVDLSFEVLIGHYSQLIKLFGAKLAEDQWADRCTSEQIFFERTNKQTEEAHRSLIDEQENCNNTRKC